MVQTGRGEDRFLTKKYQSKRERGLLDSDNIEESMHDWYGISGSWGGGETDPDTYTVKQSEWSTSTPEKFDIRNLPEVG